MTSVQAVYDAFLTKMLEEEWLNWTDDENQQDWRALLDSAIPFFKLSLNFISSPLRQIRFCLFILIYTLLIIAKNITYTIITYSFFLVNEQNS